MKKKILICVMAALCPFFGAEAQTKTAPAELKIGDTVPDILVNHIINYPAQTAKISGFRGKLLLIDFWATWCAPCIFMIPKLDSLQKEYRDEIQILPVTNMHADEVSAFLAKMDSQKKLQLPDVVDDTLLNKMFPHYSLPHFVWINSEGVVVAITGQEDVTRENIDAILKGVVPGLEHKKDVKIPYDRFQALLIHGNGDIGQQPLYHSLLIPYTPGLPAGCQYFKPDSIKGMKISCWNEGPDLLFKLAYGKGRSQFNRNRTLISLKDTAHFTSHASGQGYLNWLGQGNGFCYELIVPPALADKAWSIMQEDMNRFFPQFKVSIQKRKVNCLVLVRTSNVDKLKTTGAEHQAKFDFYSCVLHNATISEFIQPLDTYYLQNSPIPVMDKSGYSGKIDLEIQGKMFSTEEINKALKKYDLTFKTSQEEIEMLIIEDGTRN